MGERERGAPPRGLRVGREFSRAEPHSATVAAVRKRTHVSVCRPRVVPAAHLQRQGELVRRRRLERARGGEQFKENPFALQGITENLLETARTVIPWTNALRLQAAGLAACLALLAFVALTTFWKSFRLNRPVKKSAVYLMEETPA